MGFQSHKISNMAAMVAILFSSVSFFSPSHLDQKNNTLLIKPPEMIPIYM